MYIPKNMQMSDLSTTHDFIEEFGFGVIISGSLTGTHIPFVIHRNEGEYGVLYSHCAKANPHWKELENAEVLIIFSGPHSYISPSWYAHAPAVPTWNYAAVHAYGTASLLSDKQTLEAVEEVVHQYEPALLEKREIITDEFRDKLLAGIVGIKIELSRIDGKLKLGQLRKSEDQEGVYTALSQSKHTADQALALYMKKLNLGTGNLQ
ncbi:FMN-binding negative transcriptional regulator [Neptunomonas japonica]|uniref:FMN-binding negative transcriptional regulator n=1 Tax=Neptunomonas japonica TaxID=417574 RepID=UPI000413F632|nr:FMN-binding negative transcriptional regulator [Neptunomonas japonica]